MRWSDGSRSTVSVQRLESGSAGRGSAKYIRLPRRKTRPDKPKPVRVYTSVRTRAGWTCSWCSKTTPSLVAKGWMALLLRATPATAIACSSSCRESIEDDVARRFVGIAMRRLEPEALVALRGWAQGHTSLPDGARLAAMAERGFVLRRGQGGYELTRLGRVAFGILQESS